MAYTPTVNDHASICTWELAFSFRKLEQVKNFLRDLIEEDILFNFEYEYIMESDGDKHVIFISGSWANNLTRIGEMLEKVDYKMYDGE